MDSTLLSGTAEYRYQLLGRLQNDCLAFLDGSRSESRLWAGNIQDQTQAMKTLWNSLEEKPQWISLEEIETLEQEMVRVDVFADRPRY